MFLNGLRAKSIYRKVKKELKQRSYDPPTAKIRTIAILQNEDVPFNPSSKKLLAKAFGVLDKDVTELTLVKTIDKKDRFETTIFSEKQVGWNGVLKSVGLKDFSKAKYDVLINYYDKDVLPLLAVSTFSNARFKVGLTEDLITMNDLVVNVGIGNEKILIEEMKKYMRILNIID